MTTTMCKHHQQTHDAIFRHPIAHNLQRRNVMAMLGELAEVNQESNGNFKVMLNGQTLMLHASEYKSIMDVEEVMTIRHFLNHCKGPDSEATKDGGHMLVVIDHREARIYKAQLHDTHPQSIAPYDPFGFGRSLHYVQDDSNGQRKPERKSFYEAIAKTLRTATEILLFGSATGASSAMEQLLLDLQTNHPDVAQRVIGSVALNAPHLTENQLLAKAREFYEKRNISNNN